MSRDDFNKLATVPAGLGVGTYTVSAAINFAAALATIFNLIPSTPGYFGRLVAINGILRTVGGALISTPSFSCGNNANRDNMSASLSLGASFTAGFANAPAFCGSLGTNNASATLLDLATPVDCKVTVAAVGTALVATGYFLVSYQLLSTSLP